MLAGGAVAATGTPAEVFTDSTLSSVYGTQVEVETCPLLGRLLVRAEMNNCNADAPGDAVHMRQDAASPAPPDRNRFPGRIQRQRG